MSFISIFIFIQPNQQVSKSLLSEWLRLLILLKCEWAIGHTKKQIAAVALHAANYYKLYDQGKTWRGKRFQSKNVFYSNTETKIQKWPSPLFDMTQYTFPLFLFSIKNFSIDQPSGQLRPESGWLLQFTSFETPRVFKAITGEESLSACCVFPFLTVKNVISGLSVQLMHKVITREFEADR